MLKRILVVVLYILLVLTVMGCGEKSQSIAENPNHIEDVISTQIPTSTRTPSVTDFPISSEAQTPTPMPSNLWIDKPTYSDVDNDIRYKLTFDELSWRLELDEKTVISYYRLVHQKIPECEILPSVGRGLGPDLRVEKEEITLGEFTFRAAQVKNLNDKLLSINYCTDIANSHTCFWVENVDGCIQSSEEVLATLQLMPDNEFP